MNLVSLPSLRWMLAILLCGGISGCKAILSSKPDIPVENSKTVFAQEAAWADYVAAKQEHRAAWQKVQNLKTELEKARDRVQKVSKQLAALEEDSVPELQSLRETTASFEAANFRGQR